MDTEQIEQELREALTHLYDPDYQPSNALCELTGCDPADGVLAVQSAIVQAIEKLAPPTDTPSSSLARQVYDILHDRFVLKLTLEETAERLHMSFSSTWRAQRVAVHTLARSLWNRRRAHQQIAEIEGAGSIGASSEEDVWGTQAQDWRSQMERELASLRASAPDTVSDVAETIGDVAQLMNSLAPEHNARVETKYIQPDLTAAIHPSLLRQVLITAIRRLAQYSSTGQIAIYASFEGGNVKITLTSTLTSTLASTLAGTAAGTESEINAEDLVSDIVVPESMSVEVCLDGANVFLWIEAPSIGKINVLAVDDNPDMIRFYRRAALGTRYHITEVPQGQDMFETIEGALPDIIVLDVMLPDVDGWQLLMLLHENPATRSIPVVVCTVVPEEELALSLGAAFYLSKPLRRSEFIQALDRVLPQV